MSINPSSTLEDHLPLVEDVSEPPAKESRTLNSRAKKQIQGKKFFLTFPQCKTSPKRALKRLMTKYPDLKWAVVAREDHMDGTPHLHLAIYLTKKLRTRNPKHWDFIAKKHGNYQVMKNAVHVMKYVTKGSDFLCYNIDPKAWLLAKQTKKGYSFEVVAGLMRNGSSIQDIDDKSPGMVLQNLAKMEKYRLFLEAKARKEAKATLIPWSTCDVLNMDQDFRTLGLWLNNNLHGNLRPFKQRQLWLHGATNLGKTSLIMTLSKSFRVFWVSLDTKHLDGYNDEEYDLIVFDEFKGQKSITWMNGFVAGSPFMVYRRYASTMKLLNLPVIVLSNYSIEGAYSQVHLFTPERLDTIKGRFIQIEVKKYIKT